MIGSGLKKYAQENGMKVAHGVAYGAFHGFAATLSEGNGYKQIVLTTKFNDPEKLQLLQNQINQKNITREYRVRSLTFAPNGVCIVFNDNPGTMKKIRAFADWFFPMLSESGATGLDVCTECGMKMDSGCWKLVDGTAFYLHSACAEKIRREIEAENEQPAPGSYASGAIGAFLGATVGALLWAFVLYVGYVASVVGFVIGWLSEKGYNLMKGKQGKGKIVALILAVIFGVLAGTVIADVGTLLIMIAGGELPGMTAGDIPALIAYVFLEDPEYRAATIKNILMGLLFAALGVYTMLRKAGKEVSGAKMIDLEETKLIGME